MPNEKTILENMNGSPYKDYALNYLITTNNGAIGYICQMIDEENNIPKMKDGKQNPESWEVKNILVGSAHAEIRPDRDPDAEFKYVPQRTGLGLGYILDADPDEIDELDQMASRFYNKVLKDMKALNKMYQANQLAFLHGDKAAVTPEIKAKQEEVLAGMKAYQQRKEEEFEKNQAAGKQDNANSRRRYNAMEKAMNDLTIRMAYNTRLESGFAPAAQRQHHKEEPLIQEPVVKAAVNQAPLIQDQDVPAAGNKPVIQEETMDYLRSLKVLATNARGIINDSTEYLSFCMAIDNMTEVTKDILDSRKKGNIIDENTEYKRYKEAVQNLKICAKDYEDYKLSDHTENPQQEPKKKKLNSDDRTKLEIVRNVLRNKRYLGTGDPVPDIVERKLTEAQTKLRAEKGKLDEEQYPDRRESEKQYAAIAAANHIKTRRRNGEFKHITDDQFMKTAELFKKMPAFKKAMDEGADKTLYEHAVSDKGQTLYEDVSRAYKALNTQQAAIPLRSSSRRPPAAHGIGWLSLTQQRPQPLNPLRQSATISR